MTYLDRREITLEELSLEGRIINAEPIGEPRFYFYHCSRDYGADAYDSLGDFNRAKAPKGANAYATAKPEFLGRGKYKMMVRYYRINLEVYVDGEKIEK